MINDILELDPLVISSQHRKLKAVWSMEAQEDVRAMHNIDAENQLASVLAKEINDEIDREILNDLANALNGQGGKKKKKQYRSIDDPWEGT
jgi:hypothetical protein